MLPGTTYHSLPGTPGGEGREGAGGSLLERWPPEYRGREEGIRKSCDGTLRLSRCGIRFDSGLIKWQNLRVG